MRLQVMAVILYLVALPQMVAEAAVHTLQMVATEVQAEVAVATLVVLLLVELVSQVKVMLVVLVLMVLVFVVVEVVEALVQQAQTVQVVLAEMVAQELVIHTQVAQ
jgi:hypothetical protein